MKRNTGRFKRILLKISGEAVFSEGASGISSSGFKSLIEELKRLVDRQYEVAVVLGAGNIFRGAEMRQEGLLSRVTADQIGMLGTVINGLAFRDILKRFGIPAIIQSAVEITGIVYPIDHSAADDFLSSGGIVLFVGGTGNPFFSTDTAAAVRALEINADALFKATKVDGVYSHDPVERKEAEFYPEITCDEYIKKGLKVMDTAAVALCGENNLPAAIFNINVEGSITRILNGEKTGSIITP